MIYELGLVLKPESTDEVVASLTSIVSDTLSENSSELLISDDWGTLVFAQPTANGIKRGRYVYFMYQSSSRTVNQELDRRFGINDHFLKSLIVKVGEDKDQERLVKNYRCPFSKTKCGSQVDDIENKDFEKDRRRFAKKRNCWFSATKITPDWKDPATYSWLISEFGKISPARISGINRKNQRLATTTIKRARLIGLASYQSSVVADRA